MYVCLSMTTGYDQKFNFEVLRSFLVGFFSAVVSVFFGARRFLYVAFSSPCFSDSMTFLRFLSQNSRFGIARRTSVANMCQHHMYGFVSLLFQTWLWMLVVVFVDWLVWGMAAAFWSAPSSCNRQSGSLGSRTYM